MGAAAVSNRQVDYGLGECLDIYRPGISPDSTERLPVVLLWHGVGVAERGVLAPLARAVARGGSLVVVPDWRSSAADRGRAHLLASLEFARTRMDAYGGDSSRFVLAGWSRGARAGMGLVLRPEVVNGWRPGAFVGIAGGYGPRPHGQNSDAPTTGSIPLEDARSSTAAPLPVTLVHGTSDPVVDIEQSRSVAGVLRNRGWDVTLTEVPDADHSSIVWADDDHVTKRSRPGNSAQSLRDGSMTAGSVLEALDRV
ncbi:alpha/beta hydrolase [Actinopolymorpha sp. B9G3]|uniref:alpha/beta hydrolase n=1 Tax=Actinopolymorpha sp. B9G3 TaxID=3158970 RepID=UPI0032D97218